jgi:hypothetical protein
LLAGKNRRSQQLGCERNRGGDENLRFDVSTTIQQVLADARQLSTDHRITRHLLITYTCNPLHN